MRRDTETPRYDQRVLEELAAGFGVEELDAVRIAATIMDGAYEERNGTICATQTACPVLRYDENLPLSEGAQDGRRVTEDALSKFLETEEGEKWKEELTRDDL